MSDLPTRLRSAVDSADPVTLREVIGAARRRRARRVSLVAGAAAVVVAAAIVVPLTVGSNSGSPTTVRVGPAVGSSQPSGALSATATRDGVTATVTLDTDEATAGTGLGGRLVVDNRSGRPLSGGGPTCPGNVFAVVLSGGLSTPFGGFFFTACRSPFTFPTGTSSQAFVVSTLYANASGTHDLPAGTYQATLHTNGFSAIPIPAPIALTLTGQPESSGPTTTQPTVPASNPPATATPDVFVPDLAGRLQSAAESTLSVAGLQSAAREAASTVVPAGDVITEVPAAGTAVRLGSTVTVYVSSGPPGPGGTIPTIGGNPATTDEIPGSTTTATSAP